MDLSGSIQVWTVQNGVAMDQRRQIRADLVMVYRQEFYSQQGAMAAFTAEVLRIKEGPHGTDAE